MKGAICDATRVIVEEIVLEIETVKAVLEGGVICGHYAATHVEGAGVTAAVGGDPLARIFRRMIYVYKMEPIFNRRHHKIASTHHLINLVINKIPFLAS